MSECGLLVVLVLTGILGVENVCDFNNCPKTEAGMLNVHVIPHTHDDIGWLKTIDEYYYGDKSYIQRAGVQYILDSVVPELVRDKDRRFIYVEIGFFWRWWQEQDPDTQNTVRNLVESGQLEFIAGGWCMNDEAATHYSSIIDQMSLGLKFIQQTFGECGRPLVTWQIDPFGHSREQASLFAQMGMEGLFLGRIDWQDKNHRMRTSTMEMIWKASSSLGEDAWLFTGILPNNYSPPPGFCFDILCNDEPIKDNPNLEGFNVNERVDAFLNYTRKVADWYPTNNIIITMGEDFNYQHAGMWYKNLDKLIRYVNDRQSEGSAVNVFYSTPSCYVRAVHSAQPRLPDKQDDFFPYSSDPHAYWTGYFTSRPTLKFLDRFANNILQATKQISVLSNLNSREGDVDVLRRAMGNMQHHDAVTGTSKQAVAFDYAKLVDAGLQLSQKVFSDSFEVLFNEPLESQFCPLLNISLCPPTESSKWFRAFLYNPFSQTVTHYARIPVFMDTDVTSKFQISSVDGPTDAYQLTELPRSVLDMPGRASKASHELVFECTLPPLGLKSFTVKRFDARRRQYSPKQKLRPKGKYFSIGYTDVSVKVNAKTGLIESVTRDGLEVSVSQYFAWYPARPGNNSVFTERASGAYIFRPVGSQPEPLFKAEIKAIIRGELVSEIHQVFNDWVSQIVRVYKNKPYVEFQWIVGPIPVSDDVGKEIIFKINSELNSENTFHTDSNGREILQRQRNHCPAPSCVKTEPVSSNYYPVNSKIFIKDRQRQVGLSVFTDRSQGGTSLQDGSIELMVHRRLLHDDAFGVGEALNETAFGQGLVTRGTHQLLISPWSQLSVDHRVLGLHNYLLPVTSVSTKTLETNVAVRGRSLPQHVTNIDVQFEGINSGVLPNNVHILSLEFWNETSVLLRLEHFYEVKDDPELSLPVKVDISKIFKSFTVTSAEEMILGGNQLKSKVHRFSWGSEDNNDFGGPPTEGFVYVLKPMEIKTFLLEVHHSLDHENYL